ncbi:MAG: MXAN_5808 family serine peptidase, partial [Myxococcota bacterium]
MIRRHAKPLLVFLAAAAALLLTVSRRGEGPPVTLGPSPLAAAADAAHYDLSSLQIFQLSLHRVKENYVDPTRFDPKKMLLAALDYVQRSVAEVMIDEKPGGRAIAVRIDDASKDFDIAGVDSPWALSSKLKEIFAFIQQHMHKSSDVRPVEYAAINGLLSTLDPHSQLLKPEIYNEMRLSTRGEFGGLGIVIGIRKGHLTIIKPIEATPASRAGLKGGDRITKINDESTVNMTLTEAVSRLRGQPETKVMVWIERASAVAKRYVLTRDRITIRSVKSRLLKGNVAYVAIENFQGNTTDHLVDALAKLREQGAKTILLDLRGDPGGLLDQAVKVADVFVDHGTIVTTVGMGGKQREPKRAQPDGEATESMPMAVLVNEGSASASEIVAGALKNLDRAVIVGRTTFGKGTVQVLYDNDDGSALKLTIAQYLTPGDISIQQVGITPDLVTKPVWIEKGKPLRWHAEARRSTREEDLEEGEPMRAQGVRAADRPVETVYYLEAAPKWWGEAEDVTDPEESEDTPEPEDFVEDAEIRLARDLLAQARPVGRGEAPKLASRSAILAAARPFLDRRLIEETSKLQEALAKVGVDWSQPPPDAPATTLLTTLATSTPDARHGYVGAGQTLTLSLTVENRGASPAFRVRAVTKSPNPLFDEREIFVGKVEPGQQRVATLAIPVPRESLSRVDVVEAHLADASRADVATGQARVEVLGLPRPLFAYGYQILDDAGGNQDGLVQKGERVRLRVDVRNVGEGKALRVWTTLRNLSGPGIFIHKGRFQLGELEPAPLESSPPVAGTVPAATAPPTSRTADFDFEVRPEFEEKEFTLELLVYDGVLREYVSEKLRFPLADGAGPAAEAIEGTVEILRDSVEVHGGADAQSPVIGKLRGIVPATGRFGAWLRVAPGGHVGFVEAAATAPVRKTVSFRLLPMLQVTPPVLSIQSGPPATAEPTYPLRGSAIDDRRVADLYVLVSNREAKIEGKKVFYASNNGAKDARRLDFDARVPLWPGQNHVTVVARENDEVTSQRTVILTREAG